MPIETLQIGEYSGNHLTDPRK